MRRIVLGPRRMLALTAALILSLSACESAEPEGTPAAEVSPIYTAAAQTITAQQVTEVPLLLPVVPAVTPTALGVPNNGAAVPVPVTGGGAGVTGQVATCKNATFLSDVTVPDGTVMAPAQTFVKTWALSNTGTCPWTTTDSLVLVSGDPMGGVAVPLAGTVAVGETTDLSVSLTAPAAPGSYTGTWRLKDASGNYFGDVITVVITVSGTPEP